MGTPGFTSLTNGTTYGGGAGHCSIGGCGTFFELTPPDQKGNKWTETVLYSFQGDADGFGPSSDPFI